MELFFGGSPWYIIAGVGAVIALISMVLLYNRRHNRSKRKFEDTPSYIMPDEDIELLLKEIIRLRNYAHLLEEKLDGEKAAV